MPLAIVLAFGFGRLFWRFTQLMAIFGDEEIVIRNFFTTRFVLRSDFKELRAVPFWVTLVTHSGRVIPVAALSTASDVRTSERLEKLNRYLQAE